MKLRNKKTGEIVTLDSDHKDSLADFGGELLIETRTGKEYSYDTLAELNEEWEDYKPKELLIKDPKIRKAVRVWAEANELEPDYEVRYSENSFSLISWQATIEFNARISGLEHDKKYTITELCGEEEE